MHHIGAHAGTRACRGRRRPAQWARGMRDGCRESLFPGTWGRGHVGEGESLFPRRAAARTPTRTSRLECHMPGTHPWNPLAAPLGRPPPARTWNARSSASMSSTKPRALARVSLSRRACLPTCNRTGRAGDGTRSTPSPATPPAPHVADELVTNGVGEAGVVRVELLDGYGDRRSVDPPGSAGGG